MSGKLDLGGDRPAEFEPTERWVQSTVLVDDASHVRESIPQREFSQAQLNHSRKPTNNLHDRIYSVVSILFGQKISFRTMYFRGIAKYILYNPTAVLYSKPTRCS